MEKNKKIKTILKSVFVLALFAFSVQLVLGVATPPPPPIPPPPVNPPSGNVAGPLNVGPSNQVKIGGLDITGGNLRMMSATNGFFSAGPALFGDVLSVGSLNVSGAKFEVNLGNNSNFFRINLDPAMGLELRSGTSHGTPYFDFSNDATEDFDMRLILDQDDLLKIDGGWLSVSGLIHTPASGTTETPLCARANGDIKVCGGPDAPNNQFVKACIGYNRFQQGREETLVSGDVVSRLTCKNWVNTNIDDSTNYLALGCKLGTNSTIEGGKMSTSNFADTPTPVPNCGWEEYVYPTTFDIVGTSCVPVPAGKTSVTVTAIGGGGGGGGGGGIEANVGNRGAGGGGGGGGSGTMVVQTIPTSPDQSLCVSVGASGLRGLGGLSNNNGDYGESYGRDVGVDGNGGTTTISLNGVSVITAPGGARGAPGHDNKSDGTGGEGGPTIIAGGMGSQDGGGGGGGGQCLLSGNPGLQGNANMTGGDGGAQVFISSIGAVSGTGGDGGDNGQPGGTSNIANGYRGCGGGGGGGAAGSSDNRTPNGGNGGNGGSGYVTIQWLSGQQQH